MRRSLLIAVLGIFIFAGAAYGLAAQDPFACGLGGIEVPISRGEIVRSDKTENDARLGPIAADIPAGTYRIELASFDDHDESDSTQPNESWFLELGNGQRTGSISDLPDKDQFIREIIHESFEINGGIKTITAVHSVYPDKSSPNSVVPLCASFTLLEEATPIVTATEAPTATLPPATSTPDPTATSVPATLTPTWTPQVVPTYCHPDTGTCTDGGTG